MQTRSGIMKYSKNEKINHSLSLSLFLAAFAFVVVAVSYHKLFSNKFQVHIARKVRRWICSFSELGKSLPRSKCSSIICVCACIFAFSECVNWTPNWRHLRKFRAVMGNYRAVNTHTHARIVQVFIGNAVRSSYLSSLRDSLKFHVQNGCMPLCFSSNFFFSHVAKRPDHLYVTFFSRSLPLSLFVSLNDDQLVPY